MHSFLTRYVVPAAIGLVALTATVLLFFAGPAADDFCRAAISDLTEHFGASYRTHTGRWASVGLFVPLLLQRIDLFSPLQYGGMLFVLWCGHFAVFYLLIRLVVDASATWRTCAKGAALIGVLWWCGLPAPGQTVYWISAGVEYGLGFQLAAALLAAVILYAAAGKRGAGAAVAGLGLGIFALVVTGFHEIIALSVTATLIVVAAAAFMQRLDSRFKLLAFSAVGIAGAALSIFAPGNAMRAGRLQSAESPGSTLYSMYVQWYEQLVPWLLDPRLLCASFLLLSSRQFAELKPRWQTWLVDRWWLFPLCTAALVVGCLAVPAIVLGRPGPGRLQDFAYSIFVVGWFLTLFGAGRRLSLHQAPSIGPLRETVALLFIAAILFTGNMQGAVSAIAGRNNVVAWHKWLGQIESGAVRAASNGSTELVLERVPSGPVIFTYGFQRVPDRDSAHFINRCMAEYLGLSKVLVVQ
jgi:hypothetical protein